MNGLDFVGDKAPEPPANYALAVKETQPTLHEDIRDWFEAFENKLPENAVHETFDKEYGWLERRKYALLTDIKWLRF